MEQTQARRTAPELALKRSVVAGMEALIESAHLPRPVLDKVTAATIALQTEVRLEESELDPGSW